MIRLTINNLLEILYKNKTYDFIEEELKLVKESHQFLKEFSSKNLVYGVNTGFGPMVKYKISNENQIQLQYNLIRSHSSGMGNKFNRQEVKAIMILRLHTFLQGKSGVSIPLIETLLSFINHGVYPNIYEHGGVGASGDLVQLAHLSLGIIGEGKGVNISGDEKDISDILVELDLKPHNLLLRDGLAMINGTSCMTALSAINIINSRLLLNWGIKISAMMLEIFSSYDDYISIELNNVKKHYGQNEVASRIRSILKDSKLIKHRYVDNNTNFQEFYSVRCTPQILGPILDTIDFAEKVVENEINSVDDNPIIDAKQKKIVHGGNFHGDYISLEMDKLKIAITKLTILVERQLNLLLNSDSNKILPPSLNDNEPGLNYGMQGVQFTATSTTAENQMLSNPMSIHSITCNNDNQDVVSMGTNSAIITKKVIENAFQVMSIQLVAAVRSLAILKKESKACQETKVIFNAVNKIINDHSNDDTVFSEKLKSVEEYLRKI